MYCMCLQQQPYTRHAYSGYVYYQRHVVYTYTTPFRSMVMCGRSKHYKKNMNCLFGAGSHPV